MTIETKAIAKAIRDSFHYQTMGVSKTEAKHVTDAITATAYRIASNVYGIELTESDQRIEFLTACGVEV